MTYYTFDPAKLLVALAIILMMVGTIPFTPVAVGALLLGTQAELKFEWRR